MDIKEIEKWQNLKLNQLEEIKNNIITSGKYEADFLKRIEIVIEDIKAFIKFIPNNDFYKEILCYQWQGLNDRKIARIYNLKLSKFKKLMLQRHKELRTEYLKKSN